MIVFGLALGWWWRTAIAAAAVVWPVLLAASGALEVSWQLPGLVLGGALLGVVNAAVGVGVDQGVLWVARRIRGSRRTARNG